MTWRPEFCLMGKGHRYFLPPGFPHPCCLWNLIDPTGDNSPRLGHCVRCGQESERWQVFMAERDRERDEARRKREEDPVVVSAEL